MKETGSLPDKKWSGKPETSNKPSITLQPDVQGVYKTVGYVASASKPYNIWVNIFVIIMFKIILTGYKDFQINLVLTGCINDRYFMLLSLLKTESGVLSLIMFWIKLNWISMP